MPFPFLVRGSSVTRLKLPGVPLGLMEGISYEELKFHLDPGDTLILASDGTTEALNTEGAFYDIDRFTESVSRHSDKDVPEFLRSLHTELLSFIGSAELSDDITLVALRRKK
jgi:sigma-B regulation protein RsbU (phosphoserine phosphatase)